MTNFTQLTINKIKRNANFEMYFTLHNNDFKIVAQHNVDYEYTLILYCKIAGYKTFTHKMLTIPNCEYCHNRVYADDTIFHDMQKLKNDTFIKNCNKSAILHDQQIYNNTLETIVLNAFVIACCNWEKFENANFITQVNTQDELF